LHYDHHDHDHHEHPRAPTSTHEHPRAPTTTTTAAAVAALHRRVITVSTQCIAACASLAVQVLWASTNDAGDESNIAVGADGVVYHGSDDPAVFALDPSTGRPLWSMPVDGKSLGVSIGNNGLLYVSSLNSKLFAFSDSR
jgi:outer membrane protein assembly factor BamB